MEVRTLKFISIPIILVVNFLIGILPYFLINKKIKNANRRAASNSSDTNEPENVAPRVKRFLSLANFFCGGVFFATALIGVYPSVNHNFEEIQEKFPNIPEYPYAGLSLAVGFFLVWILEVLVHICIHSKGHSHVHSSKNSLDNNDVHRNSKSLKVSFTAEDNNEAVKVHLPDPVPVSVERCSQEPHSHVPMTGNLLGSLMLTFALGSHSIIEGLGFAMIDELNMTLNMLIGVLIHESICALSLGVNLATKRIPVRTALSLLATFASLVPIGIAIGIAVHMGMEDSLLGDVVIAILQGVAAGTFIYVVFIEILPSEIVQQNDALLKVTLMMFGFAIIAIMNVFHSHSHESTPLNSTTESIHAHHHGHSHVHY